MANHLIPPKNDLDELERMLEEGLAHQRAERALKSSARPLPKGRKPLPPPSWQDPATWVRTHSVGLIHEETQTLLGCFNSFIHPHLKGARRLDRVEEPTSCDTLETVHGDWWIAPQRSLAAAARQWIEERELQVGVSLKEMDLHCPDVAVKVRLYFRAMEKVLLLSPTRFGCPSRHTFLILPAGLDILPAMDLDSKIALFNQIKAEFKEDDSSDALSSDEGDAASMALPAPSDLNSLSLVDGEEGG